MLSDQSKFIKVDVSDYDLLKFSIKQEKQFDRFLRSLKDKKKIISI